MKLFKSSMPFSALGLVFIGAGIVFTDPKQFSFGLVWFLIAAAKVVLAERTERQNKKA